MVFTPLVSIQWLSNSYKHKEYYPVDNLCPVQTWLSEHLKGKRLVLCEKHSWTYEQTIKTMGNCGR